MSQRLHIGKTTKTYYDCVLEDEHGAEEKLKRDWLMCGGGMFVGPWKIRIGDIELWSRVEPVIAQVFAELGEKYPENVWAFYRDDRSLEHPSKDELREWLFRPNDRTQVRREP